jgi:hypothetical protein
MRRPRARSPADRDRDPRRRLVRRQREARHQTDARSKGQCDRTKAAHGVAISGGSIGRPRRVTTSTPASTCGTGRNSAAGILRPSWNSHHGAQTVESSVDGGTAARLQATSHWTMTWARLSGTLGSSRRRRRISVVAPKGRDPITRNGRVGRANVRKSASTTRTCPTQRMLARSR